MDTKKRHKGMVEKVTDIKCSCGNDTFRLKDILIMSEAPSPGGLFPIYTKTKIECSVCGKEFRFT